MPRHAKNSTAGSVYTYHERMKDSKQSGFGSKEVRVGKDSIKDFDCCCLTLQPCKNPVVTKEGHLFDKEAILQYILGQKKAIARKLKEYEKQKLKFKEQSLQKSASQHDEKVKKFEQTNNLVSGVAKPVKPGTSAEKSASISNVQDGKAKELPSFWLPSLTPQADETVLEKPDEKVRCPMSGKVLKLKDLIPVKFTPINDRDSKALIVKDARYVCAVTNDVLGNSVPCAVLKPSGSVVTMECVEKIIKKDMFDPINGTPLTDKDIIPLQRGATGFAGAGAGLAKKYGASLMA